MSPFDYAAPRSIAEAAALLQQAGDDGRVLAGGTDLIVQVRENRRRVKLFIDVKNIPELNELSCSARKGLVIGAAVPCYRITSDSKVAQAYPGLLDAAGIIGGVQIQGRASIGGNLCNASPAADSIPALIALEAACVIAGPQGSREVPVEQFCTGPGKTVLGRGEMVVALRLPPPKKGSGAHYLRFIPRNEMDIAVVGAGASVVLDKAGKTIVSARIALGAVAPTPLYVAEAGAALAGREVSEAAVLQAAESARAAARPITDMRGSAAQRKHLSAVLVRRALEKAIERARNGRA
ncbi:MAG: xanthine dehydrogenase family protein subunit M [Planctomycetes bacterium]|nr:xanthine dehydrogenase family protein subunit M [Planctomycetota bacterium]